jgi:uncharacterized membrane protein
MSRRHEVTRLEAFSDAVFGFALTLLVVSLEVPDTFAALVNSMRGFLPFALMFAMICWIWYEHQKFFRRYGLEDAWTVAINSCLLFVVLFYVYPLKFLTKSLIGPLVGMPHTPTFDSDNSAYALMWLYDAGVVMIFGVFVMLHRHAWRQREQLRLTAEDEVELRYATRSHVISMSLGVASIVAVYLIKVTNHPGWLALAGLLYMLMGPLQAWNGAAGGRAQRAIRQQTANTPS